MKNYIKINEEEYVRQIKLIDKYKVAPKSRISSEENTRELHHFSACFL